MAQVKVLVLRTAGTNCDQETCHAFHLANAEVEKVHVNRLIENPKLLENYQSLALPGGFSYGDDIAAGRGVDVKRTRRRIFLAASLLVGGVVSICGPIAFVGMMAPHICRLIIGEGHTRLAPASFLFGGTFLVLCDTLARTVIAPAEIPVGVITSLLGGPFFLWLLLGGAAEKSLIFGRDTT